MRMSCWSRRWAIPSLPTNERGVFKTTDGGKTWRKVLYKDDKTGAIDVAFAPDNPQIGFAALWYHYVKPDTPFAGLLGTGGAGIYKTTDGGETWTAGRDSATGQGASRAHGRGGRARRPARLTLSFPSAKKAASIAPTMAAQPGRRTTEDRARDRQRLLQQGFLDPHNPDIVYRRADFALSLDRWRQDLRVLQGRARRRRQSRCCGSIPPTPTT